MKSYFLVFGNLFVFISAFGVFGQTVQENVISTKPSFAIDASTPERFRIAHIAIKGAEHYDQTVIKAIAGLNEGAIIHIPGDEISRAIQNLWNEGLFSDVDIAIEKQDGDLVYLLIQLKTRPLLSRFRFEGVNKREADKIREQIKLFSGKPISDNLMYSTEAKIRSFYKEKGFHAAIVKVSVSDDPIMDNSQIFTITIDKKKRVKVEEITFENVEAIKPWRLKMAMKNTKQKSFWRFYKQSKFSELGYRDDKKAILEEYNKLGLRDAKIDDSVYQASPSGLNIDMNIDEGEVYYFGKIEWVGNTKFRSTFLDSVLGIRSGDRYNKQLFEQRLFMSMDGRDISSLYMDRGYLFFRLVPVETSIVDHKINYQIRIIEGKQARVRNVIIKGNTRTKEHVIRREIRTKPGDLFNRNDIIRTQQELAQLGFFNPQGFQVNPIPNPEDGTVDIEYIVEEQIAEKFELSGSIGGDGSKDNPMRLIGSVGFSFDNFSMKNMLRKEKWEPVPMGDGQQLKFRVSSTTNYFSTQLSFTEPWLGGKKPNALSVWARFDRNGNEWRKGDPDYSGLDVFDLGVSLSRRRKWPDDYFSESFQLNYKYYDVTNAESFVAFDSGYSHDLSLGYTLQRSTVMSPIYPQSGSKFKLSGKATLPYSLFDGIDDYSNQTDQQRYKMLEYYRLKLTGEWYLPLTPNKKLVLAPRIGFGYLGTYSSAKGVSPFGRFVMGGNGMFGSGNYLNGQESIALRGYQDAALSSESGDPLIAKYSVEVRYPISLNPQFTVYGLAFAEAGNTFPSIGQFDPFNVKRSAGLGLRLYVPMFGLIGIDYGFGFDKLDNWSQEATDHNSIINTNGYSTKLNFTLGLNIGEL